AKPEAGEGGRGAPAGSRGTEAVGPDAGRQDAPAEPEPGAHRAVGGERPAERGQLARAVRVPPHRQRLGRTHRRARYEATGQTRAERACPRVRHRAAARSACPSISDGTGTPKKASAVG